jgi:hypothetical protein
MAAAPRKPAPALHVVNAGSKYRKPSMLAPTELGYLHLGAAVRPHRVPVVLPNRERTELLKALRARAAWLERLEQVVRVLVFRAIVMPPTGRLARDLAERNDSMHVADFDVAMLIETRSPAAAREVQRTEPYHRLLKELEGHAHALHVMAARSARRIGDVAATQDGLYLFNHFAAADAGVMLELWEHLAGWYVAETGLDNSIALVPLEGERSDYAIVHWARWNENPIRHFWRQLSQKSFRTYVTANLDANRAGSMPIYYRLA